MTAAKTTFDVNAERATYFLDIHQEKQQGAGAPTGPYRELPRGALVFAVGALDAYLSELSAEVLVARAQIGPGGGTVVEVLKRIQSDLPALALELALLGTAEERRRRLQDSIVDHFHNNVSNHGSKAVAAAVQRLGGKPADFWTALTGAGYPNAAFDLDEWTKVRHEIVHKGKKPSVRRPQAEEFIRLAKAIVCQLELLAH